MGGEVYTDAHTDNVVILYAYILFLRNESSVAMWDSGLQTFLITYPYNSKNNYHTPPVLAYIFIYKFINYVYKHGEKQSNNTPMETQRGEEI
jgi:hypothetical protein